MAISRGMSILPEKVVLRYRSKTRHMLGENCPVITPTQKDSSMSFTEWRATPSWNRSARQLDHSPEILSCVESLQQSSAPTKDVVRGDRSGEVSDSDSDSESDSVSCSGLILIHIMNLTLGLSILRKNSLPNLRRKLHQRFLKIRPTWEDFSTGARSKCTSEMYLHNNKETYHR